MCEIVLKSWKSAAKKIIIVKRKQKNENEYVYVQMKHNDNKIQYDNVKEISSELAKALSRE